MFNSWKVENGKKYSSKTEDLYRLSVFTQNNADIMRHNAGDSTYTLGLTLFADLTSEEFISTYTGIKEQE